MCRVARLHSANSSSCESVSRLSTPPLATLVGGPPVLSVDMRGPSGPSGPPQLLVAEKADLSVLSSTCARAAAGAGGGGGC
eukprot:2107100-Prymnesium_polylepis.1